MKTWQPIYLQLGRQNVSLGTNVTIYGVLQDSYTSEFLITLEGSITTAAATAAIEGLAAFIQAVNINGPLPGYQTQTPVNGLSGPMLVELGQFIRRCVSYSWGALGTTGKFGVTIPCTFIQPRMGRFALMSCLPTRNMGAVNFTVQMANTAQLDTNATPTLAVGSLSLYVQQNEFKTNSIPPLSPLVPAGQVQTGAFQYVPQTQNYVQNTSIQSSQATQQLFPNGTYSLILMRAFTTCATTGVATGRQSDTAVAGPLDLSITSQGITIQDVNQTPKQVDTFYTIRKENLDNIEDSLTTGNACLEFNNGLHQVFQPVEGPNQLPIKYATTTTGTTNPRIDFVYQQLFDEENWLQLV